MAGNDKAISVRIEGASQAATRGQNQHDLRTGRIPKYVNEDRIKLNSVIIENKTEGKLRALCEQRRGKKKQKMRATASVSMRGIITFGKEAQKVMGELDRETQDRALQAVAIAVAKQLGIELTGLVVHRDESALHAHFQMPAWREDGQALSQFTNPAVLSEIQDVAALAIQPFAPTIERGKKKAQRLQEGDKPSDVIHKSVRQLHDELPAEIEAKQVEINALLDKIQTHESRLAKLREEAELSEKEAKRLETYQSRADQAKRQVEKLEQEMELSAKLLEFGTQTIERQKDEIAILEADKYVIQNEISFTSDGQDLFEAAIILQTEAMDEALALNPDTPEIVEEKYTQASQSDGKPIRFSNDEVQNGFAHRFIKYGFELVATFFHKFQTSFALAERSRQVPQPIQQMQNNVVALRESITEILTALGIADKRIDLDEPAENGDPPPVLELVFSRAERKANRLNKELANQYSIGSPKL